MMASLTRFLTALFAAVLGSLLLSACAAEPEPQGPVVLAAASMQEALGDAADRWAEQGHLRPVLSFAASGALARQIALGAPADIYISADERWMDWLAQNVPLKPDSRAVLASNQLALIAPKGSTVDFPARGEWSAALGNGKIALADPDAVPAGRYGKAALIWLDAWNDVRDQSVVAADVRGALALVSRGDAALGVVYISDAKADSAVRVVGTFPTESHAPILYDIARPALSRHPDAAGFREFLLSKEGQAILAAHGFGPPPDSDAADATQEPTP
ncbi:molybdate ABC transporter substrate-binding protein [Croceicoccus ponticola]|uniref:Molybdate ABC transporter substrate-binding protein n=1 Tax=Croceicoccus ponticola TaxID=2217664 RepID=A0A437GVJ3_9SPHN|nr:molybdate ABC transporter substrate-binding protein [Croceicoccus ponticola]RVQ65810.1 molybdate ABC transporter substrate-binding protein [Croceicoccus ponticola]